MVLYHNYHVVDADADIMHNNPTILLIQQKNSECRFGF